MDILDISLIYFQILFYMAGKLTVVNYLFENSALSSPFFTVFVTNIAAT
jgi:hypothetical protein